MGPGICSKTGKQFDGLAYNGLPLKLMMVIDMIGQGAKPVYYARLQSSACSEIIGTAYNNKKLLPSICKWMTIICLSSNLAFQCSTSSVDQFERMAYSE